MEKKQSSSSIKKKQKVPSREADKEVDIYKKVCEFEEKEAQRADANDSESYFQACHDIRDILATIRDMKNTPEMAPDKSDLLSNIAVRICIIRKLNRIDKLRYVGASETLNAEKLKCDSIKLNYQNLVYELDNLVTETNKCLSFKSHDEDIQLVSLSEFMTKAPKSVTEKFKNFDENNTEQKHALRLARLEWELTQRKNLAKECQLLEEKKKKILSEIAERKDKLSSMSPLLMSVLKAAKPLQEHLGLGTESQREDNKLALMLPEPLYIFYVSMTGYKNVYGNNINVEIHGDKDEAIQWIEAQEVSNDNNSMNEESDQESDLPEVEEVVEVVKKRRHRKSVQVDPMEDKRKRLLECHPLKVEVSCKLDNGPTLVISFHYYTKLKIVVVRSKIDLKQQKCTAISAQEILCSNNILNELIENDFGVDSPNPSNAYQLKKLGITSFEQLDIGYAYIWAQNVCGIEFLPVKRLNYKQQPKCIENIMKIIQKRLVTRTNLAQQMQELENNILPESSAICALTKWRPCPYMKYCQCAFTQSLVEEEIVAHNDLLYEAVVTRSNAHLQAMIAVKNNYPTTPPIFALSLSMNNRTFNALNSDEIRDLERIINVNCVEEQGSNSLSVLTSQLRKLCYCFDIWLESMEPDNFPQSAKFLRSCCGRNRKKPFNFKRIGTGIFTPY